MWRYVYYWLPANTCFCFVLDEREYLKELRRLSKLIFDVDLNKYGNGFDVFLRVSGGTSILCVWVWLWAIAEKCRMELCQHTTDIIFPHPHTVDLDQASYTKFPLEFPRVVFHRLTSRALFWPRNAGAGQFSLQPSHYSWLREHWKAAGQLQLAFTWGQRDCEWVRDWWVKSGSDVLRPPKETHDTFSEWGSGRIAHSFPTK